MWLWVIGLVVIIGTIAVVAAGRNDTMVDVYEDRPDATLPTGRALTADDLAAVRFSTAVRGYRMDEVDAFVARLQDDLLARRSDAAPDELDRLDSRGDGDLGELDSRGDGDLGELNSRGEGGLDRLDTQDERGIDSRDEQAHPPIPPSGASAITPP
jgi:DivIVA domain-containing protein